MSTQTKPVTAGITLTQQELTKAQCVYNMKKIESPTTSSPVDLYGYGNAGRAASQVWRAYE